MDELAIPNQEPITWHPKFRVDTFAEGTTLLSEEGEFYFFPRGPLDPLWESLAQKKTLDQALVAFPDIVRSALAFREVRTLFEKGIVVLARPRETQYHSLPAQKEITPLRPAIFGLVHKPLHWEWLSLVDWPAHTQVVIAEELLHPSLASWVLLQRSESLLVVSRYAGRWMVGPWLKHEGGPCFRCLVNQVWRGQPQRRWIQRHSPKSFLSLPALNEVEPPSLLAIQSALQALHNEPDACYDVATGEAYVVHKRPQCPVCGNPGHMAEQTLYPAPIVWESLGEMGEGGYRTASAQAMLHHLLPFANTVTGFMTLAKETPAGVMGSQFPMSPPLGRHVGRDSFWPLSLGKGNSTEQKMVSALGESVERWAAQYQGDEYTILALPQDLPGVYLLPQDLASYSTAQYDAFKEPKGILAQHAVKSYLGDVPLTWTLAWTLQDQQPVFVPAEAIYAMTPTEDFAYLKWNSNGAAAGQSTEEALVQGLFEVIERDAVAIWWYNQLERPSVEVSEASVYGGDDMLEALYPEWEVWVLDLTHDLEVPVRVAIGQHREDGSYALGFGCHLVSAYATFRALAELDQLIPIRKQGNKSFDFDTMPKARFLFPHGKTKTAKDDAVSVSQAELIQQTLGRMAAQGLIPVYHEYSRPDLPLKTVKVVVPGMAHTWPQFACDRLYEVPIRMGWQAETQAETALNPIPLYL